MKREFLQNFKVGEQPLTKEIIDAIMAENGRDIEAANPNWTQKNKAYQFLAGGGAITAMDGWTASTLWPWAENKVRREQPGLEKGTPEQIAAGESPFYKAVAKEFDNAVSRSQSVSDEMHQSSLRKDPNPLTKVFTLFRSDTAQAYNALRQKAGEAAYYKKTGQTAKANQAKRELGQVVGAMMINNSWAAAISMLMALIKHRDRRYRDEEGNLTWSSALQEIMMDMAGSVAGVMVGGEELFELIGNIATGNRWYDLNTMGLEQLNETLATINQEGARIKGFVEGMIDVYVNDGDMGDYWQDHYRDLLGGVKKMAMTAAGYFGIPVGNLEAYLMGIIRTVAPDMGVRYDDTFSTPEKADLRGLTGRQLRARMRDTLASRGIHMDIGTVNELAELYEAGGTGAFPGDVPGKVTVNGEDRELSATQQLTYNEVVRQSLEGAIDELVSSNDWAMADDKTKQKMLDRLYGYAGSQAKAALFDDYPISKTDKETDRILGAGMGLAELVRWDVKTAGMKAYRKAELLESMKLPEQAKRLLFGSRISESQQDKIDAITGAGVSFDGFLKAYSEFGRIKEAGGKASEQALAFSRWVDGQRLSQNQKAAIRENLKYFGMMPASAGKYDKLVAAGMSSDKAYSLMESINALQPLPGADEVTDLQKWQACIKSSRSKEDQLAALEQYMSESQYKKVSVAGNHNISPESWIRLQEIKTRFDADGNGSYKQDEITAAIDSIPGLSRDQRAVLWQLSGSSWSAKKNPYSEAVGQRILDELRGNDRLGSFSDEVARQLRGNW